MTKKKKSGSGKTIRYKPAGSHSKAMKANTKKLKKFNQ